jgi:hypothetical protein
MASRKTYTEVTLVSFNIEQRAKLGRLAKDLGITMTEVVRLCVDNVTAAELRQMLAAYHQRQAEAVMKAEATGAQLPLISANPKRKRKREK